VLDTDEKVEILAGNILVLVFTFVVGVSAYGSAFYCRSWFNQSVLSDDGCDGGKWSEKFAVA